MPQSVAQLPKLPTELWIRILSTIKASESGNLTDLWISMRHVSTAFKEAVESVFRDRYLSKTYIDFLLGIAHHLC